MVAIEAPLQGRKAVWRVEQAIPPDVLERLDGRSVMLSHLLYCRGFQTPEAIRDFYAERHVSHDPFLLPDMQKAVDRIGTAIDAKEEVVVYGDFDCDGVTAAAILVEGLAALGLKTEAHIPTRDDGHGLHPETLEQLRSSGTQLIITADCGITATEEVRLAQELAMDVIVTDHHEARLDGSLPNCPTIDPTRQDSAYPFRHLCGGGVVYKLLQALTASLPTSWKASEVADLVAMATIADIVPLRDENRSLVIAGLEALKSTQRPGLLALFQAAGVDRSRVDPISVSYYLAPRINAANRLASPQLAYDLITATDAERAKQLANQLSEHNQERQLLVIQHFQTIAEEIGLAGELVAQVIEGRVPPVLIATGDWPAGISGLLASKLVETYGLPAFVGTEAQEDTISVSARSIPDVHIDEILDACQNAVSGGLFLGFGGHAGAGGFRVHRDLFDTAKQLLEEEARKRVSVEQIGAVLSIDAEVLPQQLNLDAAQKVRSLAPFGVGFPEPLFLARGVTLRRISCSENGHARLTVQKGNSRVDGIYFNADDELLALPLETKIDAVFHFQLSEWQQLLKPEICLRDWRLSV